MKTCLKISTLLIAGSLTLMSCSSDQNSEKALSNIERSIAYEKQGQYRAALIEVRNAIQADPENPDYLKHYAGLLIAMGTPNQAEDLLLDHDDLLDDFRLTLVDALLQQGKFITAKSYLDGWQPDSSQKQEYDRLTALQHYLSGNKAVALKQFRSIAARPDASFDSRVDLIKILINDGQLAEATQQIQKLLTAYPDDPEALYLGALLATENNDLETAEKNLTDALTQLPSTDVMLNNKLQILELLSDVLTRLGRPDEALIYSKLIREANPEVFAAKQQYKDALASAQSGDLTSAKAAFEDILNQFPNNQQAAMLLGLIHIEEGDVEAGEQLLSENLDTEIAPTSIIRATALAQAELDKPDQALLVLEKALLAKPDDVTLLSLYGVISLNNGQDQQGLKAINKALQLAPNKTRLHLLMAQYYVDQNKSELALGHLRKAYNESPTDWPTTSFYLSLLIKNDDRAEAEKVKNEIATNYGDDVSALWVLSMVEYQLGNTQASIDTLVKLHRKEPDSIRVTNALAKLYRQTGKYELSSNMWLQAVGANPGDLKLVTELIADRMKLGTVGDLVDYLNSQAAKNPQIAATLHAATIELMVNQGQLTKAKDLFSQYSGSKAPQVKLMQAAILRGEALALAQQQQWQKALSKAKEADQLLQNNVGITLLKARLELKNGNSDDAVKTLTNALNSKPNNVRLITEKTKLLAQVSNPQEAYNYLKPIWQKQPHGGLAQVYFGLVNQLSPEQMEPAVKELLRAEPNNAGALNTLAGIKQQKGLTGEAINYYKRAIDASPNLVPALNNLAWMLKDSRPKDALAYSKRAAELAPNSAAVLDTYGWILHLNGQNDEAIRYIDRALELAPNNADIKSHRAKIS